MSQKSMMTRWRMKQKAGFPVICGICDEPISEGGDKGKGNLSADHIIPKSLGGTSMNSNLQPAHKICNNKRQNILLHEFKDAMKGQARVERAIEIIDTYGTQGLPERARSVWTVLLVLIRKMLR